jgi:hypothetical protein
MRHRLPTFGLLLLLPFLGSCGGDSTSAPVPSRIVVTPGSATLDAVGLTQQFSAQVLDKNGNPFGGGAVTWISTNPEVASVSASGLATSLKKGNATIQASAEGLTGSAGLAVSPVAAEVVKASGDTQTGALSQPLAELLEVEVTDSQGNPVDGTSVTFVVLAGGGSVTPFSTVTDSEGRATASWTLGCSDDDPQRVAARAGVISAEFTASADLDLPAICQESIPDGRATYPYSVELEVVAAGITLSADGLLAGTPTTPGTSTFRARVLDGIGKEAARDFGLRICDAPLSLSPGESLFTGPPGPESCGLFLPSGQVGDRYRIGLVWASSNPGDTLAASLPTVTLSATKASPVGAPAQPVTVEQLTPEPEAQDWLAGLPGHFRTALEVDAATEAYHHRLRAKEWGMIRAMGPSARLLPDARTLGRVSGPQMAAPEKLSLFARQGESCSAAAPAKVTALKVAENDLMVIYQDSTQAQDDEQKITTGLAEMMLDYYRDYGEEVIDSYFGGYTDINEDGQVAVFVTPVVDSLVAAYVWSGDFFPVESCSTSNEMELIRFNASTIRDMLDGGYQALGTLVHEMKHVSSLYKSISRYYASGETDPGYHPSWIEEGTAEIAGEMASRLAWEASGGPALGAMIRKSDKVITKESYGILLKWARTILYLGSQPNGLVGTPAGAHSGSVYGSGWHFHRWLGDTYGNGSATRLGDAPLFTVLNDSLTASGVAGIREFTGKSWSELVDEHASAVMLVGTGAPQPEWAFTSHDFPDVTDGLLVTQRDGFYPWPVNVSGNETTQTFASFISSGTVGPSGIRVYDLTSDGTGSGLELRVETTRTPVRVVVVRIQ